MFGIFFKTTNSFTGQLPDEKVVILVRQHWFVPFISFLFFAALAALPFFFEPFLHDALARYALASLYWFAVVLYFMLWWGLLFYTLTMYLLTTWIITNHRIIASYQLGLFRRTVSEARIERVQDVSVSVHGIVPTLLHFGNISVQTAGTSERISLTRVPDPKHIKNILLGIESGG